MTAVAGECTTPSRTDRLATLARRPIVAAVAIPWLLTRALAIVVWTMVGESHGRPNVRRLLSWDSGWYQMIADHGYGPKPTQWPPGLGGWTKLPFFPLFPASWRGLVALGIPHIPAVVLIGGVSTFVAMWGTWRLAERHLDERLARHAVWLVGLLPGSLTFVIGYPDALYLAASVWAFVFVERRRFLWAAVAAAVAAAARPNGILLLVPLAILLASATDLDLRSRLRAAVAVALPSVLFLASWCVFLGLWMGDPIAFFTAKRAWDETSLRTFIVHPANFIAAANLAVGLAAIALYSARARKQPAAWSVHAALTLLPPFALGLVGLIRYTSQCCFTPIAAAAAVARHRRLEMALFAGTGAALVVYGYLVTQRNYVP